MEELGPSWTRSKLRHQGVPAYRLVRCADDFVVMAGGTRADAVALWGQVNSVLAPLGLRLSVDKSGVCHIDEGFDLLGLRIQRRAWHGRPVLSAATRLDRRIAGSAASTTVSSTCTTPGSKWDLAPRA